MGRILRQDQERGEPDLPRHRRRPSPLDRATGFQYLSRYISKALNERFEFNEPEFPQLWQLQTPTNKSFGDNPDCTYLVTWLDGKYTYRIVGNRGTVSWVSFICQTKDFASTSAVLNNSQLKTEWDGSFQITLSARAAARQLAQDPARSNLPVYPAVFRRMGHRGADDDTGRAGRRRKRPPPPLTPERLIRGLQESADWMVQDSARWVDWVDHYAGKPNQFVVPGCRVGSATAASSH